MLKTFIYNHPHLFFTLIFGLGSVLTSATFIVPFLTTVPAGALVEAVVGTLTGTTPYSKVGFVSIWVFAVLSIALIVSASRVEIKKRGQLKMRSRLGIYVMLLFLFHPLAFYLYWWLGMNFRGDGQLFYAVVETSVYGGAFFLIPGVALEIVRSYALALSTSISRTPYQDADTIARLKQTYQQLSNAELEQICAEEGWTREAGTAAKHILNERLNGLSATPQPAGQQGR